MDLQRIFWSKPGIRVGAMGGLAILLSLMLLADGLRTLRAGAGRPKAAPAVGEEPVPDPSGYAVPLQLAGGAVGLLAGVALILLGSRISREDPLDEDDMGRPPTKPDR